MKHFRSTLRGPPQQGGQLWQAGRIATRMEAFIYFSIKISENFGKMKITRDMHVTTELLMLL